MASDPGLLAFTFLLLRCPGTPISRAEGGQDRLGVVLTLPHGQVDRWTAVTVVFDRPVVAMGAADPTPETGRRILAIDPLPEGHYRWLGTRTLSYVVPYGLPRGTAYRATLSRRLTALDGSRPERDSTWTFSTPGPRLVSSFPTWGDRLIRPGEPIVLAFDQPVDPTEVARHAGLEGVKRFTASRPAQTLLDSLAYRFRGLPVDHLVQLDPRPSLVRDRSYVLSLDSDLHGTEGPLPGASDTVAFLTYPPLEVYRLSPIEYGGIQFTTPVNGDSLRRYLTIDPVPEDFALRGHGTWVRIASWFDPQTTYTIRIRKGLPDLFGQHLAKDAILYITPQSPYVRRGPVSLSPSTGMYYLGAPRRIEVGFRNVKDARVRARVVSPEEMLSPHDDDSGKTWDLEHTYPDLSHNESLRDTLDLEALAPPGTPGNVEVVATAQARKDTGWVVVGRRSILAWTDVAATARFTRDDGVVWVTRISSGDPVSDARIILEESRGGRLWEGRTDAQGLVRTPGRLALIGKYANLRARVVSRFGTAQTLPSRRPDLDRNQPPRFPLRHPSPTRETSDVAFVYGDRPLYRPGEVVHLAGIVRRLDARGIVASPLDSVWIQVGSWERSFSADTSLALDEHGGFTLDLFRESRAGLGRYQVSIYGEVFHGRGRSIGYSNFRVAEYRVDPAGVDITDFPDDLTPGDTLRARVAGSYWFGAPIAGGPFAWWLDAQPIDRPLPITNFSLTPERNEEGDPQQGRTEWHRNGEGTLGEDGTSIVSVSLTEGTIPLPARLTLEATVRSADQTSVAARASARVHPADLYAGVGIDRTYVPRGDSASVRTAVFDAHTAELVPGIPVRVAFLRHRLHGVPHLEIGGRVRVEYEAADSVLQEVEVRSGSAPDTLTWMPPGPGTYVVRASVTDARGRVNRAEARLLASGRPPAKKRPRSRGTLEMVTDRDEYQPGQTARIAVPDSLVGPRALLTVEREGLLESRVLNLPLPNGVVEVPLGHAASPNVFVGLEVPAPSPKALETGGEEARARYQEGLCELEVDPSSRRLTVDVSPSHESIGPGEMQTLRLRATRSDGTPVRARVGVAVVDEAVLAFRPQPVPDPLEFFYEPRGFDTWSSETRERMVISDAFGLSAGVAAQGGRPGIRRRFASTAYWNPSILTDDDGRAEVQFRVPDDLTTFRVVAVADAGVDLFGSASTEFRTTRPLVVEPALPRFLVPGDSLELAATVTNRSGAALAGTLRVESDLPLGSTSTTVKLADGQSGRYGFRTVVPPDVPDSVAVRFFAAADSLYDAVEKVLPIEPAWTEEAQAAAGGTRDSTTEVIALPEAAIPGSASLEVTLSSNVLGEAMPVFEYLKNQPAFCLEQAASRTLALAIYRNLVGADSTTGEAAAAESSLAHAVRDLQEFRVPYGGFGLWRGGGRDDQYLYLQLYALYALDRAREAGADVDTTLFSNELQGTGWVDEFFKIPWRPDNIDDDWFSRVPRGFSFFVGVELQEVLPGLISAEYRDFLIGLRERLGLEQQVFLALGLARLGVHPEVMAELLRRVENRLVVTANQATAPAGEGEWLPRSFHTPVRATAISLWLASRSDAPDRLRTLLAHGLLSLREHGRWSNTQDDALALLALEAYEETVTPDPSPFTAQMALDGEAPPLLKHRFVGELAAPVRTHADLSGILPKVERRLDVISEPGHLVHYATLLRWKESALNRPAHDGGLCVERRVEPLTGGDTLRVGDVAVVRLLVVVPREVAFLAITDPLPAGLEAIQAEFATTSRALIREVYAIPWDYPSLYAQWEIADRQVRAFTSQVAPGVYELRYAALVRAVGSFGERPTVVEAMYRPELRASSGSGWLSVAEGLFP